MPRSYRFAIIALGALVAAGGIATALIAVFGPGDAWRRIRSLFGAAVAVASGATIIYGGYTGSVPSWILRLPGRRRDP